MGVIDYNIIQKIVISVRSERLYEDFADYAPFLWLYGATDFVESEIANIRILTSDFSRPFQKKNYYSSFSENYEIIFGLIELFRITGRNDFLVNAVKLLKVCLSCYIYKDKIIIGKYHVLPIPVVSLYEYIMVELLLDIYELTRNEEYLSKAETLINGLRIYSNERSSLLTSYLWLILPNILNAIKKPDGFFIGKNSAVIFGLIRMAYLTKDNKLFDKIRLMLSEIIDKMTSQDDYVYRYLKIDKGIKSDPCLSATFMLCNMLNNYTYFSGDTSLLNISCKLADRYLIDQGSTGLFPYMPGDKRTFIDAETDFSVCLLELYDLTLNEKYKIAARKCYDGILKFNLYFSSVNIDSGEEEDPILFRARKTRGKFQALFLKLAYVIENNCQVFGENSAYYFLRDR